MKRVLSILTLVFGIGSSVFAQEKGDVRDFGSFKLHTYISDAPMPDLSYIIEGKKGVVILEPPTFVKSIQDFQNYVRALNKPIVKVVADYHVGGLNEWELSKIVMVEGMPEFEKGEAYSGMLSYFRSTFGEDIDLREHKSTAIIPRDAKEKWAGISFTFLPGAVSDFPASSINIGGKVFYTHFSPTKAHISSLQINSRAAVNALIAELERAKKSGCKLIIGSHGVPADIETLDFQIAYLGKMKEVLNETGKKDDFIRRMKNAYPSLDGEKDLIDVAEILYK